LFKQIKDSIDRMSGHEAKDVLLGLMYRLQTIREQGNNSSESLAVLYELQDRILQLPNETRKVERPYNAIHIVCGESPAGSLRVALGRENKIIGFPDFFAVGPISELDQETGRKRRYEWLRDHLNYPDDFIEEEYENRFSKTLTEIETIPDDKPIVLWTADNADEQAGVRYLLYLLKGKRNKISMINATTDYKYLFNTKEFSYNYPHTGEISPEQLQTIFEKIKREPLSTEDRVRFEMEWLSLSESDEVVRIWQEDEVISVKEDYFDEQLVITALNLHAKQRQKDFIKSARIVGEVYGQMENNVGDAFLEYRLRSLIYRGVFEIKGIPKGMRYYSVKLVKGS
jgi:hypothetical protein